MKDQLKKPKPTLESLLKEQKVITGKKHIANLEEIQQEAQKQKELINEAIEFERRNRRKRER